MSNQFAKVEFMIRVKLPERNPRPSDGYDENYSSAINAAKPYGFEVKWPRDGESWPVDSEGFTFVPLYLSTTEGGPVNVWIDRYYRAAERLEEIHKQAEEIASKAKHF